MQGALLLNPDHATTSKPASINHVPYELLVEIFLWYLRAAYDFCTLAPHLTLRQVCCAWRDIMLRDPRLSTYVCLTRYYHFQELLQTSGSELPLNVYVPNRSFRLADSDDGRRLFKLLMEKFERVERAKLKLAGFVLEWEWDATTSESELLRSRVSRLQSMELVIFDPRWSRWNLIPPLFWAFEFPHLTELSCANCNLGCLKTLFVPTLRRLKIVDPSRTRVAHLVERLRPLCSLEELVLENVFVGIHEILDPGYQQTYFPKLRHLAIQDTHAEFGFDFLRYIRYPPTANVSILHVHPDSPSNYPHSVVLSILAEKFKHLVETENLPQSFSLCAYKPYQPIDRSCSPASTYTTLTLWRSRLSLDEIRIRCHNEYDADALLKFSLDMREEFVTSFLNTIRVALRDVRSAVVTDDSTILDQRFISATSQLRALEEFESKRRIHPMLNLGSAWRFEEVEESGGSVSPRDGGISGLVKRAYRESIRRLSMRGSSP